MAPSSVVPHCRVRAIGGWLAVLVLASVLATATAAGSSADPIADKTAQAAALAQKIDAQGHQIEVLAEQYDGARLRADQISHQLAAASSALRQAERQAFVARASLGRQAVGAYVNGGYLASPKAPPLNGHVDLVVQQVYFGLATTNEADALVQMRNAERNLAARRAELQITERDSHAAVDALAARQVAVVAATDADKATLSQVKGELVQLVAEQQARLEAQRIAQEKAALAAQLARAQAEARAQAAAAAAAAQARATAAAAAAAAAAQERAKAAASANAAAAAAHAGQSPAASAQPAPPGSSRGLIALGFARAQLGKPYVWGAAGPATYDCSGLTMQAWGAAGVALPHFAAAQYAAVAHVAIADLQPGDLVFFGTDISHVGIYAGGGQMVDAPFTGSVVRYDSIFWGDLLGGGRPG